MSTQPASGIFQWTQSVGSTRFGGSVILFTDGALRVELNDHAHLDFIHSGIADIAGIDEDSVFPVLFMANRTVDGASVDAIAAALEELAAEAATTITKLALCGVCKQLKTDIHDGTCTPCAFATVMYRPRTETEITQVGADGTATKKKKVVFGVVDHIDDCPICLETLFPIADALYKTPCGHVFHRRCYATHVVKQRERDRDAACPLCRAPPDDGGVSDDEEVIIDDE